jgi:hypothetical protein
MSFQPDFKHRLSTIIEENKALSIGDFTDTLFLMCGKTKAILDLLYLQFEHEEAARCSNTTIADALYATINEIEDITAMTKAFCEQGSSKPQAPDVGGAA